ncbi:MAG: DUF1788 domain-containing protein [Chloroflexota bacterium]|nr:DUF1788 domain-containing protein [Chloroflexota bacterium]
MTADPTVLSPEQRYAHLFDVISSPRFLKMQGLGNEVPFFICSYPPRQAVEMSKMGKRLMGKLKSNGVQVLKINLYDLSIELLCERGIWDRIIKVETTTPKDSLKELLQNVLDVERHLVPAMVEKMQAQPFDVLFISGVGEVFPYIRSHTVLNNLQSKAQNHPTVLFFPGSYTQSPEEGASLDLFGRLHDDKYYRAFDIFDFQV